MTGAGDIRFVKVLIAVNGIVPLAMLGWDWNQGNLGANPIEFILSTTGYLTLIFLLLSLAVTPLRKMTGRNELIRFRRLVGLLAFFYGCVHLITYSIFDKSLDLSAIVSDVWERPFIALGMSALGIMLPLAITSTNGWIKRLGGKRWQKLHRLVYLAGIFAVLHFWLIQKSDFSWPIVGVLVLAALLIYRVWAKFAPKAGASAKA
ncbi:MAG: sulfoxide reductase heme-binding subunit YedZ [Acidobacteria bacterium]|nr:MAG: sulfoxide reductase heme-binding subunit YedZ [Acidobacteriota bacterium]REK02017.1 MAG: sulfoxide reductase heme-binding subunit YedZ [Acidobacteriota bacterium]REK14975.1 MAG: sulfoxide reductase heme-binding subunit YedZ [Acidobacteriota bacterium]REK45689.1 MAG: sulfoxide reductase heme-binding subunit YedZ [Acidobacteriota bacterium]